MRFGLFGLNFGPCADPALAIRVAVAAEESGFESVWTGEHVAMPIRDHPVPTPARTRFLASPALRRAARFGDGWYGVGLTVEAAAPMVQELRRLRATTGRPPLEISLTTFEPLTPALVAQATQVGVNRLIVMPRVRGEQLEATVRALGAELAR